MAGRRFSWIAPIKQFLSPETIHLLNRPTKAEVEMVYGQEQLPLGEDFTDPIARQRQYREHMAQMDAREKAIAESFVPEIPFTGEGQLQLTPKSLDIGARMKTAEDLVQEANAARLPVPVIPAHEKDLYGVSEMETLYGEGDIPANVLANLPDVSDPMKSRWVRTEETHRFGHQKWLDGDTLTDEAYLAKYGQPKPWYQVPLESLPTRERAPNLIFPWSTPEEIAWAREPVPAAAWWTEVNRAKQRELAEKAANPVRYKVKPKGNWSRGRVQGNIQMVPALGQDERLLDVMPEGTWEHYGIDPAPGDPTDPVEGTHTRRAQLRQPKPGQGYRFHPSLSTLANEVLNFGGPKPKEVTNLFDIRRRLEDLTREGVAQPMAPSQVPLTPSAKVDIDEIVEAGIAPRDYMQVLWDRVMSQHGPFAAGTVERADEEFAKITMGILDAYNGLLATGEVDREGGALTRKIPALTRISPEAKANFAAEVGPFDPNRETSEDYRLRVQEYLARYEPTLDRAQSIRLAQAYLTEARSLFPGVGSEGAAVREMEEDESHIASQIIEKGMKGLGSSFQGNQNSAEERATTGRIERTVDSKRRAIIGHQALEAMNRVTRGMRADQVANVRRGITDIMLVERGQFEPGAHRIGTDDPIDVEVLEVIPMSPEMQAGYLSEVSKRTGIPLRNLKILAQLNDRLPPELQMPMDLVRVQPYTGEEPRGLPPMARRRTPEEVKFQKGAQGKLARERMMANPAFLERLLAAGSARVLTAANSTSGKYVAVVTGKGKGDQMKVWGISLGPNGEIHTTPLSREEGRILWKEGWNSKKNQREPHYIARNAIETDPNANDWDGFGREFHKDRPWLPAPDLPARPAGGESEAGVYTPYTPDTATVRLGGLEGKQPEPPGGGFVTGGVREDKSPTREVSLMSDKAMAPYVEQTMFYRNMAHLPEVPGLQLAETPVRDMEAVAKIPFYLQRTPLIGSAKGIDRQVLPKGEQAHLTVVITQRNPSKKFPQGFAKYKSGEARTLVNPTADELRAVLLHSNIQNVVFKVMEGETDTSGVTSRGRALNTWHRALALMTEARRGPTPDYTPTETVDRFLGPKPQDNLPPGVFPASKTFEGPLDEGGVPTQIPITERLFEEGLYGLPPSGAIDPNILNRIRFYERGGNPSDSALAKQQGTRDKRAAAQKLERTWGISQDERDRTRIAQREGLSTDEDIRKAQQAGLREELASATSPRVHEDRARAEAHSERLAKYMAFLKKAGLSAGAIAAIMQALEGKSEAATHVPKGDWKAAHAASKAAQAAEPNVYQHGFTANLRKKFLDMFDPIYKGIVREGGTEEDALDLREAISTASGGGGAEAEVDFNPVRRAMDTFEQQGMGEAFEAFLTAKQGLRQWDVVAEKRDTALVEYRVALANGNQRLATQKKQIADLLNQRMAEGKVWQLDASKEDLANQLRGIRSDIGYEKFAEMQSASQDIYQVVQLKLDEMYAKGLVPDESYALYKKRGPDHIPAFKTAWEVNPETGKTEYKGGEKFEKITSSIEGSTEQLLEEVMGNVQLAKSPLENAARFVSEGTAEIKRTDIAQAVIQKFGPLDKAERIGVPKPGQVAKEGYGFYTILEKGQPVTYEMPTYLVDTMLMVDKELTKKLMAAMPGAETISWMRAIPEAGMTSVNLGFGLSQGTIIDPITALVQTEWANDKILANVAPFAQKWFTHVIDGIKRGETGESSALRKRAAKAGALHSGVAGQMRDPRDLLGDQSWTRAKKAFKDKKFGTAIQQGVQAGLNPIARTIMQPLEEATKLATFDLLTEQGVPDMKAAYQTRKYGGSPDWGQGGDADILLKTAVTFGKPALLGIEAGLMAAKRNPRRLAKVMAGSLMIEMARQAFAELTAAQLGTTQKELNNRFSEYDKDNTYLVMIPPALAKPMFGSAQETLSNGITRPYAIKHTIPPVLRLWMSPFKGLAKAISSGNVGDVPLGIADEMVPGTVPLEADNFGETAIRRAGGSLPAIYRAPLEQLADWQFFTGAPIVGSRLKGLTGADQYSESTDPVYKWLGQKTGFSPKRMEHWGQAMLPGSFQLPIQAANAALADRTTPPVQKGALEALGDVPLLGPTLFKRLTPQRYEEELGDLQDDFYGLNEQTRAAAQAVNKYEKGLSMRPSELTMLMDQANPMVASLVRDLSQLAEFQQMVVMHPTMNPAEKQARIKMATDRKRDLMRAFLSNSAMRDLSQGQMPAGVGVR